jgi:hypothetical protein
MGNLFSSHKNRLGEFYIEIPKGMVTVFDFQMKKAIEYGNPEYFCEQNIKENVIVYFQVDKNGSVKKSAILKGNNADLNESILKSINERKYNPFIVDDNPVSAQFMEMFFYPKDYDKKSKIREEIVFSNLQLPYVTKWTDPVYPKIAVNKGLADTIKIDVVHDIYGRVIKLRVVQGKHEALINSAKEAIKTWIHQPLVNSGNPLEMKYRVVVKYDPKKKIANTKILFKLNYEEKCKSLKHLLDLVEK